MVRQTMNRSFLIFLMMTLLIMLTACRVPVTGETQTTVSAPALYEVRTAIVYENITDPIAGRSQGDTIRILQETHPDLLFRGFWQWMPVVNSPEEIPPELIWFAVEQAESQGRPLPTDEQIAAGLRRSGHYYANLQRYITDTRKTLPRLVFVGAVGAQTLPRVSWNPLTGHVYSAEETWDMALDPQKWGIEHNGRPVTKEQFQAWFYGIHPYTGPIEEYDPQRVSAYFPDLTNPRFQELLLSWARKQIECGADAIWIDLLYRQATVLAQITGDVNHPSVQDSLAAATGIVESLQQYTSTQGQRVYVGSWAGPFVLVELADTAFPYEPPPVDFVTVTPSIGEILQQELDTAKWQQVRTLIREKYGDIPVIAFIDWSFDASPMVAFSQRLSVEEQRNVLREFDQHFQGLDIIFAYPVHGGYLGAGEATTRLAFGEYRIYDALAPEFNTFETIVDLSRLRSPAGESR